MSKYLVTVDFTPNEHYKSFFVKTPLGIILNPEFPEDWQTTLNDMLLDIELIGKLEAENKMVSVKRTYETGFGRIELRLQYGKTLFNLFQICLITLLTASITFVITFIFLR